MYIIRHDEDAVDGLIKCLYIGIWKCRLLIALSSSTWYTKGKRRTMPIWISKDGLFVYKLALKIGQEPYHKKDEKHETS